MTKKAKAEATKDEVENKTPKKAEAAPKQAKAAPPPKQIKAAKKPIESIGLKAMRAVNLNADDESDTMPAPKQIKKVLSPLAAIKEEPAVARAVEVSNGRISLDSALNNIADQRRIMAQNAARPQMAEKPILKELAALQRK